MSMIEINWNPKPKELRNFGVIALIALALISILLYLLKGIGIQWIILLNSLSLAIFLSSIISFKLTKIIYLGLTLVTLPIGWMMSFLILTIFYFLLLTPLALIFRLAGRDLLNRKFDPTADSYWLRRTGPDKMDRYFHQF
jgi:hypothetical protein